MCTSNKNNNQRFFDFHMLNVQLYLLFCIRKMKKKPNLLIARVEWLNYFLHIIFGFLIFFSGLIAIFKVVRAIFEVEQIRSKRNQDKKNYVLWFKILCSLVGEKNLISRISSQLIMVISNKRLLLVFSFFFRLYLKCCRCSVKFNWIWSPWNWNKIKVHI